MPAQVSLSVQASLAQAHRDGRHEGVDGTRARNPVTDPSGYWREAGCPLCQRDNRLSQASDFELVRRLDIQDKAITVWVLREVESRGVWTIGTFGHNPEADYAVSPWGDLMDGGYNPSRAPFNVPAGIWHKLSEELS